MDKFSVKLYARAKRDLESIYSYIANELLEPIIANNLIDKLENAILSLETFPERGTIRQIGVYSTGEYRQLFIENYIIIYKVKKESSEVHIVTVRYAMRNP